MLKFLKDLVTSAVEPDKASHTKFWSNVGMAAMTAVFLWYGFNNTLPEWYVWLYAPTVVAPHLLSDLINLRWGLSLKKDKDPSDENK
ncbi:hypothetical protein A71_133 [Escherichia phage A7_1]|uniref:Uncharacterized protein n=2 Tax=Vequintavirinae TaxID=1911928 RepID=A0AAE9VYQ3_9CAUD|nr:hypothetical protein A71_133 [Escherichia phage A7_1]UZZ64211.1 hypothetical protein A54_247 [Escherichia phage A5-4]WBF77568.1 hypothetical protein A73_122 [Escherichia phage A73]WBF77832.1 hypothetical protein W70_108 [Escherichia phage W70]